MQAKELLRGDDAAVLPAPAQGERLAFSTDSFVVTPHFFPGGVSAVWLYAAR